jgi:hypothetical protein
MTAYIPTARAVTGPSVKVSAALALLKNPIGREGGKE